MNESHMYPLNGLDEQILSGSVPDTIPEDFDPVQHVGVCPECNVMVEGPNDHMYDCVFNPGFCI